MTWICFVTLPQKERAARDLLTSRGGYEVFLPIEHKWRRQSRYAAKRRPVEYPLLPRYIFVRLDPRLWPLVRRAYANVLVGVVGLEDGRAATFHQDAIDRLALTSRALLERKAATTIHKGLQIGSLVEITYGPGMDEPGEKRLVGIRGQKARIIMRLFGTRREVEIGADRLRAA